MKLRACRFSESHTTSAAGQKLLAEWHDLGTNYLERKNI